MELELDDMCQEIDPNSGINIDSVKLSTFQWDIKCKIYITKLASNYFQKCHKFGTRWSEAGWPGCSTRWRVRRSRWPTSVSTPSRGARRRTSPETVLSLHETWWDFLKCLFHARSSPKCIVMTLGNPEASEGWAGGRKRGEVLFLGCQGGSTLRPVKFV